MNHPNEVILVFRTASGKYLPMRDFDRWVLRAKALSPAHHEALLVQAGRQQAAA